ncbi:hypothetical protein ACFO3C_03085 [Halostagnicola sp. GCM10023398]|uniref:hypothetical protein n=1 Tax=Natrialbaceae TaxID=1644061 RepID=UPI003611ECD3
MRQGNCPLSAASAGFEVAFVTPHWHYHRDDSRLELRVLAEGEDRRTVERGLETIRSHPETDRSSCSRNRGRTRERDSRWERLAR